MPLTASVTAGKKFAAGEAVDNSKLNQAASPTVAISGAASEDQLDDEAVAIGKTNFDDGNATAAGLRALGTLPIRDLTTARPVFDVRSYGAVGDGVTDDQPAIQGAIDAAIVEGGGTILFPEGDFNLNTPEYTTGYFRMLQAYSPSEPVKLRFCGVRGGGSRLKTGFNGTAVAGVTLLHFEGAMVEVVVEDLWFEETNQAGRNDWTSEAVTIRDSTGTMRNVRIEGCHFRNFSRAILGGCPGLRILNSEWTHPVGRQGPIGTPSVGIWLLRLSTLGTGPQGVMICNNRMDGLEAVEGTPIDGFVTGTSEGWTIKGNVIRRVTSEGIIVGERKISEVSVRPSWPQRPRGIVIEGNTIEFETVVGTAYDVRTGIDLRDCRATVTGNTIRGCYKGIYVVGTEYNAADDAGTRMQDFVLAGNVITMAEDLLIADANSYNEAARAGIFLSGVGSAVVTGNQVRFPSRTSTGLAAKYFPVYGIGLYVCDNGLVSGNQVQGPSGPTNADHLWVTGIFLGGTRDCQVEGNKLRSLNIGCNGAWETSVNGPARNEWGYNPSYEVVWPIVSSALEGNGTYTPAGGLNPIVPKATGLGHRFTAQRTSFLAGTTGWIRVAGFDGGFGHGEVRIWSEDDGNAFVATLDFGYHGGSATGFGSGTLLQRMLSFNALAALTPATTQLPLVTKVRCAADTVVADGKVHLDLWVATASPTTRIWVEVRSVSVFGGVWAEPVAVASTRVGWTGAVNVVQLDLARGLKGSGELALQDLGTGHLLAPGTWDGNHLVFGGRHLWLNASNKVMIKTTAGAPASDADGIVLGTQA